MRAGLFEHWQAEYAAHGIATFPVGPDKTPAISGYLKIGLKGSAKLATGFGDAPAIGFGVKRHRITVLDVDSTDERLLADRLDRHGPTPLVILTGSRHYHGYYRNNGEGRRTRRKDEPPVDILGDGFVVAAPSQCAMGDYQILQGSLDDLASLPTMRQSEQVPPVEKGMVEGDGRNSDMFRYCLRAAVNARTMEELMDDAMAHNHAEYAESLAADEVLEVVASAWGYEVEGKNLARRGQRVVVAFEVVDKLAAQHPRAFALYNILRRYHGSGTAFILANAMAEKLGWDGRAFRAARDTLVGFGLMRCLHGGGRGPADPPIFMFAA